MDTNLRHLMADVDCTCDSLAIMQLKKVKALCAITPRCHESLPQPCSCENDKTDQIHDKSIQTEWLHLQLHFVFGMCWLIQCITAVLMSPMTDLSPCSEPSPSLAKDYLSCYPPGVPGLRGWLGLAYIQKTPLQGASNPLSKTKFSQVSWACDWRIWSILASLQKALNLEWNT